MSTKNFASARFSNRHECHDQSHRACMSYSAENKQGWRARPRRLTTATRFLKAAPPSRRSVVLPCTVLIAGQLLLFGCKNVEDCIEDKRQECITRAEQCVPTSPNDVTCDAQMYLCNSEDILRSYRIVCEGEPF